MYSALERRAAGQRWLADAAARLSCLRCVFRFDLKPGCWFLLLHPQLAFSGLAFAIAFVEGTAHFLHPVVGAEPLIVCRWCVCRNRLLFSYLMTMGWI